MEARFSTPVQTGRGVHPNSCTIGTGSFPGVKRPGRGVGHPLPSRPSKPVLRRISPFYSYPLDSVNLISLPTSEVRTFVMLLRTAENESARPWGLL